MSMLYGDQLWFRIEKLWIRIAFWILLPTFPKTLQIDDNPGSSDIKENGPSFIESLLGQMAFVSLYKLQLFFRPHVCLFYLVELFQVFP